MPWWGWLIVALAGFVWALFEYVHKLANRLNGAEGEIRRLRSLVTPLDPRQIKRAPAFRAAPGRDEMDELRLQYLAGRGWQLRPDVEVIDHADGSRTIYGPGVNGSIRLWWGPGPAPTRAARRTARP